jgi:ABC-type multidrug transport system fused ATPase/permease subunit
MMKSWFSYLNKGLSRKLPVDRIAGEKSYGGIKANIKHLIPHLKRYRRQGIAGFCMIMAASACAFPPPLVTRYLIDDVILRQQVQLLAGAVVLLVVILAAEKILRLLADYYFTRLEQTVILDIHQDLLARVLRFPKEIFDDHPTGYLMSRISEDVEDVRWFFSQTIVHVISNILRFAGGIGFLIYLEWKLAAVVLILLPVLGLCIRYFSTRIHILSHRGMEQSAAVSGRVQESLSRADLIKAYAAQDRTVKRVTTGLKAFFNNSLQQTAVNSLANLVINSMPGMGRAIVLAVGAIWIINGQWTLGSLLAFQAYLGYVFGPAQFLASANVQFSRALAALERISALSDVVPEDNSVNAKAVKRLNGKVEFKNVGFSYNGQDAILKDISFTIQSGERIAIAGPSGVGKTTLLSLIMRFYKPSSGEIYFDGRPASDYQLASLRRRIGYVSQRSQLLAGSIVDNLQYGNPDAGRRQVMRAAKIAGIKSFIEGLPDGYDAEIGPRGVNLSEGQKQRLAIARAIIKDPDILVFDEPTAAFDTRTEKSFMDALPAALKNKTLIIATHRPAIIDNADRVFLLNESRLVDVGTHRSLRESNASYVEALANDHEDFSPQAEQISAKPVV